MSETQPLCLGCWAVVNPGRAPERITGADEDDCCVCGDPTVSGLSLPDPATVQFPTEDK